MMDPLKSISESLVQRYSNRYRELGDSIRTLGWGSTEQQRYRFAMSLSLLGNTAGKKIVDVGCGFADFFRFLIESGVEFESYLGVDINEDLLGQARQKCNDPRATFERINILTEPPAEPLGDILVMFGILNFHLKEKMNNLDYTRMFVKNAFSLGPLPAPCLPLYDLPDFFVRPFVHGPPLCDCALAIRGHCRLVSACSARRSCAGRMVYDS